MTLYFANNELSSLADSLSNNITDTKLCTNISVLDGIVNLYLDVDGLYLYSDKFKPLNLLLFYNEFINKRKNTISRENLVQAINIGKLKSQVAELSALDLTGGLGRDSVILALAGFNVTIVERNWYLAIILRYLSISFTHLFNLKVVFGDSYLYMQQNELNYTIAYFDPMFEDGKRALSKKDMQLIDILVGLDESKLVDISPEDFFYSILSHCNKLIVKRDNKQASFFSSSKPTYQKLGKTIRFDIYQGLSNLASNSMHT